MHLVADRFVATDAGRVVDLATGERVVLRIANAGDASEQARWLLRCDALHTLHHFAVAQLVDYGTIGTTQRFEARLCGPPWSGARPEAEFVRTSAEAYLAAGALTAGDLSVDAVRVGPSGGPTVLPDSATGYALPAPPSSAQRVLPTELCAVNRIPRPAVSALAEIFEQHCGPRPHVAALWGPRGSGKRTAAMTLARAARVNGFIPVHASLIGSVFADLWKGRSVVVIDAGARGSGCKALLQTVARVAQPHALVIIGEEEQRTIDGVAIGRIPAELLARAVHPACTDHRAAARVRHAAEASAGLPARFVARLWPPFVHTGGRRPGDRSLFVGARVAEQRAAYGGLETCDDRDLLSVARPSSEMAGTWPAPDDLAALRRKIDGALLQLSRGRHEPGVRQLRQAIGGLARRDAWTDAAHGAIALARALLSRGRVTDAHAALDTGREYATRAGEEPILIDVAIVCGEAWIDRARLDEAESVLGAALCAARARGDRARTAAASLSLGRTLFWRGRYAEAAATLSGLHGTDDLQSAARLRYHALSARCAVGVRDYASAMSSIRSALDAADAGGDAALTAAAHCDAAFVHLAVNDLASVDTHVSLARRAARTSHRPLLAVRARLLSIEADRRRGSRIALRSHLQRLTAGDAVPDIVSVRCRLVADLISSRDMTETIVSRHVHATGLHALSLYAPGRQSVAGDPFVEDVVTIVRACQAADDEVNVLKDVCRHIRDQLRAAAIACVAFHRGEYSIVAADGARLDTAVAERAVTSSLVIAPHLAGERIEAAAPVQYGGTVVGAVCARWTVGSTTDRSRASTMLTTAAAATAPVLASAIARRDRPIMPGPSELTGVTQSIVELRHAVERAAAAPFAVLIEGESGSGKELVARAIHRSGPRRDRVFCTVNCAAMPDDLIEAELFGHARGSFTGAVADRPGVFEEAHGGTLFLDEAGELSPRAQAKLLRVIQEGELRRIGENVSRRVDVRLLAATNRDLRQEVAAGRFRLDLLYRLDVIRISVPPLRDRREDIAALAEQLWRDATARIGSRATLGAATIAALTRYDWPGNVRELQNVLASLAVRSAKRGVVPVSALPPQFAETEPGEVWRLDAARRTFEERFVRAALVRSGGHRGRAAAELGVTRQGLTKLMTRLGIAE